MAPNDRRKMGMKATITWDHGGAAVVDGAAVPAASTTGRPSGKAPCAPEPTSGCEPKDRLSLRQPGQPADPRLEGLRKREVDRVRRRLKSFWKARRREEGTLHDLFEECR